jgi:hypothetical protein
MFHIVETYSRYPILGSLIAVRLAILSSNGPTAPAGRQDKYIWLPSGLNLFI